MEMLRIVTGRSGSGKTEYLLRLMRDKQDAIYIVPEQYTFAAEKRLTEAFGVSGMGGPVVLSFGRLGHYMEEKAGRSKKGVITPSGRVMAMQSIVKKKADELTLFGGAAKRGDMAQTAAVIASTFKQYGVTGEKLTAAAEKIKNPLLKKKLGDCLVIYEAYGALLEKGYKDSEDELEILRKNIEESGELRGREIFIDSFTAFTPLEYSVIAAMMRTAENVTVSLTAAEGDEFVTSGRTMNRLRQMAEETKTGIKEIRNLPGAMYTASDEMKALEASFFEDEFRVFDGETDKVHLCRAKNAYEEAVMAARETERLCRDFGMRYRDIVIVARDLSGYEKYLKKAFRRFNIPLFMDRKTSLAREAAALFVLSAIRIVSGGWKEESVFCYMKTVFSPISAEEADELENYVLAAGVRRSDWKSEDDWTMTPSLYDEETDPESLKRINNMRRRLTEPIKRLESGIKGRKTGSEAAKAFYAFIEECSLSEKTEKMAQELTERGENEDALKMRQVYDMITGVLESFENAFRNEKMSAGEFCDILSAGLESVEIGVIPAAADTVCAGSIDRARGHGAKAVIIIGAAEGRFPAAPKDDGLFSDFDRRELEKCGIELPPDTRGKAYMEKSLLYGALSCAKERIYASFPMSDKDGACAPSEIIKRIYRVFPKAKVTDVSASGIEKIGSAKGTFDDFAASFADASEGRDPGGVWRTALEYYKNSPEWKDKTEELYEYTRFENKSAAIREELIRARYGGEIKASVSRLEEYARCPFQYFADVTLSLRERKKLEMTAADSGSFLHEFVDMFGKGLAEDNRQWRDVDKAYIDKRADEIVSELLGGINSHLLETSPRVRQTFANLKRIAKKSVTILAEHMKKGRFEPLGYEIVFDDDGDFKPIKIELPNGQSAVLRGRVDRADILETERGSFVRIIDYKSGEKEFKLSGIYYGLDLQLAIYLTAVCENSGAKPAGMLYFKIDDPMIDADSEADEEYVLKESAKRLRMDGLVLKDDEILEAMDKSYAAGSDVINVKRKKNGEYYSGSQLAEESEFKAISSYAKKTVRKLCGEILSGKADISPVKGACTYCKMKEVCAFDTSLKGCSYRKNDKINDRDALLKMIESQAKDEGTNSDGR